MKLLPQLRAVAQQSSARHVGWMGKPEAQLTADKIKIVSLENYSPMTRLSLYVRAGARHETGFNLGTSHCLRSAANLATKQKTAVALTRTVQQIGASLTTTGTKEHIIYSVETDRNKADTALECLLEVVFDPEFHHWEISRMKKQMELELALHKQNYEERVIELLHQAAFRTTVGRSLYAPEYMMGKFSPDMLNKYREAHFGLDRMALVGSGCPHDWLHSRAMSIINAPGPSVRHFPTNPQKPAEVPNKPVTAPALPNDEAAQYFGGQHREEADHNLALIAVAGEGAALNSKDSPAGFVLQRVFGAGPRVKYSASQNHSRLAKAVASALPGDAPFAISGLGYSYSDCGLLGFFLSCDPSVAGKAARAAVLETAKIAGGSLTDAEFNTAKQQAKTDLLFSMEHDCTYSESLAQSALLTGQLQQSCDEALAKIDAVKMSDVLEVAKRVVSSKPSMAAVGDLSDTPYVEKIVS